MAAARTIVFAIVTPERVVVEQPVVQVTLPVVGGVVTVLPDHVPYIGALAAGEIVLRTASGEDIALAASGGIVEFHGGRLTILADTAERAEDIDLERAEKARRQAEEAMRAVATGDEQYARVAAQLEKEFARVRVARRHARRAAAPPVSSN